MNNPRLLTVMLAASLSGGGLIATCQKPCVVTIEELFDIAEQHSLQLRPSRSAEETALREIAEAKTNRLPDINASLSLSYIGDGFTIKRNISDYQKAPIPHFGNGLSINISQPIFTGGAITCGIELAELKLTATRYASELKRDNIRFQIAGFYLDIYKYKNLRKVVDKNIEQARKVLAEMQERYRQGTALKNDITRYELLTENLELQLIKIKNTIKILNSNLVSATGLSAGTVIDPDPAILNRSIPSATEIDWRNEALEQSPILLLAQSKTDISRKMERIENARRLPKIEIQACWTIDGPILTEIPPINRNLSYWFVGLGVSYDISSLYKTNKSVVRSKAATLQATDELNAARENVELAIHTDHIHYLEAYEELKTQLKSVELAETNYSTVSTRYSADMALITDLLDAANSKLDAEQRLVNAKIDIIYYYYKLLFTSGKI